ncbi:MAG: ABC transporter substrate-binding protein, partial [Comamonas sp.]
GVVPANFKVQAFDGFTWVNDAHYIVVPKGVSAEKRAVIAKVITFMLAPEQQALTYDDGYFYPGPAAKEVPLSAAPTRSQEVIAQYGRPEYARLIAERPHAVPLDASAMVAAFQKWDAEVGALKSK